MWKNFQRLFWKGVFKLLVFLFADVTVTGRENLPSNQERPLIVVANHFSFFEPVVLFTHLPFEMRFLASVEITERPFVNKLFALFDGIPVWRGQIDRNALNAVQAALDNKETVMIFPEGGVLPELQERVQGGEQIAHDNEEVGGLASRLSAELIAARRGIAFVATKSDAQILPVALLHTEKIAANLGFPWKRTKVEMHIGKVFGPLDVDAGLRGSAKKARQQELADEIMCQIAILMPEENRGPFKNLDALTAKSASQKSEHV